jgi:hypothetical protein
MKLRDRIIDLRRVKAADLVPRADNWRTHPETQRAALQGVLGEIGIADALLVRELPDGRLELLDGHLRRDVTPESEWPVLVVDLDDDEARLLLATLDPLAAMAEADEQKLGELLAGLEAQDEAVRAMLDGLAAENGEAGGGSAGSDSPELEISAELFERQDYLIVTFDNEFDWQVACERLGVKTVTAAKNETSTIEQRGVGRVLTARQLFAAMGIE